MIDTLKIATEEVCRYEWGKKVSGNFFRCGFCGYHIRVGDVYRVIDIDHNFNPEDKPVIIVCSSCNDTYENLIKKWEIKTKEWDSFVNKSHWWFFNASTDKLGRAWHI